MIPRNVDRDRGDDPEAQVRSALHLLVASLGFGSLGPLASIAYGAGMGPATFVTIRAALGAVSLWVLRSARRRTAPRTSHLRRREKILLAVAILLNGGFSLALFAAFRVATVPTVLTIYFTYPAIVAIMSTALGRERLTALRTGGIAVAIVGVLLVVSNGAPGGENALAGMALAALAATLQASYLVVARAGFPSVPAEQAIGLVLTGGALMAFPVAVIADGPEVGSWALESRAWAALLAASVLGTAVPKVWVLGAVRALGATRSAVIMLAEPFFGVLLATLALGQPFGMQQAIGGLIVLVAAVAVQRPAPGRTAVAAQD